MSGLSPKQLEAVSGVARGLTPNAIAKELGISERTIQRWQKSSEFTEALNEIRQRSTAKVIVEVSENVATRIQSLVPKAIDTLQSYIENPEARGSDRLRACYIIGSWAGLNQLQKQELQNPPEETLKSYLNYLASTNGNSNLPITISQFSGDKNLLNLRLWEKQEEILEEFWNGNYSIGVWALGRRSGKTLMSAVIATYAACMLSEFYKSFLRSGEKFYIVSVANTIDQAKIALQGVKDLINSSPIFKAFNC